MTLSPRPAPAVGAHVGADPIATASEHGFDIVQIFVGDPQAWKGHAVDHPGGAAGLKAEADAAGVPAFVVFTDATLLAVAEQVPANRDDLAGIGGIGPAKLARYGDGLLEVLTRHR